MLLQLLFHQMKCLNLIKFIHVQYIRSALTPYVPYEVKILVIYVHACKYIRRKVQYGNISIFILHNFSLYKHCVVIINWYIWVFYKFNNHAQFMQFV